VHDLPVSHALLIVSNHGQLLLADIAIASVRIWARWMSSLHLDIERKCKEAPVLRVILVQLLIDYRHLDSYPFEQVLNDILLNSMIDKLRKTKLRERMQKLVTEFLSLMLSPSQKQGKVQGWDYFNRGVDSHDIDDRRSR